MSKAAIERLCKLKQWHLRYSAFLMGLPSGGTKSELAQSIVLAVKEPHPVKAVQRIVSVDMGIRNLAYCVLDANVVEKSSSRPTSALVKAWKRVDLTAKRPVEDVLAAEETDVEEELFKPPNLAKVAYKTTRELLDHKPDVILIEQQRWRSGGRAGVQQWTIRVNTFESQLWACLRTLQKSDVRSIEHFPSTFQVDPKRVADFLPTARQGILRFSDQVHNVETYRAFETSLKRASDSASGKKQKIDLVRSWLHDGSPGDVSLSFDREAAMTADGLRGRSCQNKIAGAKRGAGKVDDLADCLLQGITWLRWQENRDMAWLEMQEAQNG